MFFNSTKARARTRIFGAAMDAGGRAAIAWFRAQAYLRGHGGASVGPYRARCDRIESLMRSIHLF